MKNSHSPTPAVNHDCSLRATCNVLLWNFTTSIYLLTGNFKWLFIALKILVHNMIILYYNLGSVVNNTFTTCRTYFSFILTCYFSSWHGQSVLIVYIYIVNILSSNSSSLKSYFLLKLTCYNKCTFYCYCKWIDFLSPQFDTECTDFIHLQFLIFEGTFSDFHNIFLWHEWEAYKPKSLFTKFQLIPILCFQVRHDYMCFIDPIDYCVE